MLIISTSSLKDSLKKDKDYHDIIFADQVYDPFALPIRTISPSAALPISLCKGKRPTVGIIHRFLLEVK